MARIGPQFGSSISGLQSFKSSCDSEVLHPKTTVCLNTKESLNRIFYYYFLLSSFDELNELEVS